MAPAPLAAAGLRWVSVLFVDLVGYTALAAGRDAEEARELLSGYFELARTVVRRYGGTVEKFIGDAVMAVWGAEVTSEDDAERAVRAGLELVGAIPAYGEGTGAPGLAARAGVVTGRVAAVVNPEEGLVAGERVTTASRIQALAEPGQVVVDDATRRASEAAIAYAALGEHTVKGQMEPVALWRAVRVVATTGGRQRVDGLETDQVGRTRELALVKELFHATVEDRRARCVLVTGAAGAGKSRLGWEFDKYVDGLAEDVWWHSGRCLAYGEGVSFWALAEMVRARLGIAENESSEVAAARIAERLPRWVPDPAEQQFLAPRIGVLVGATAASFPRGELFSAWRLFIERLTDSNSVVLAVDDLQWADQGLLDFLDHLLDYAANRPIFMLGFARPELAERRSGWPAGRGNATTVSLAPLPDPVLHRLVDALVPGMPAAATARIVEQAQGIPLYAVETIRALIDRDVVVPQEGQYRLVGELGPLDAVPAGLTALIAARLDALADEERGLVKALSVLGGSFPRTAVAAVTDAPTQKVDELLRSLVRKEVLRVTDNPLSPDRGQYAFVQNLLRTVAHSALTKRERRRLHLAVATHLGSTDPDGGDDVAEVIAAHYHDAYRTDTSLPDAAEVRAKAAHAYEQAGGRASTVGAPDTAEGFFRLAAELAANEKTATRLLLLAGQADEQAGRYLDAVRTYEQIEELHRSAGRDREMAATAVRLALMLGELGRYEEAIDKANMALCILDDGHPSADLARLYSSLAWASRGAGQRVSAQEYIELALDTAAAVDQASALAEAAYFRGVFLAEDGRYGEAIAISRWAAEVAADADSTWVELWARMNLGNICLMSDRTGAEEQTGAALELARRLGDRNGEAATLGNLALLHLLTGDWTAAENEAMRALEVAPDPDSLIWVRSRLVLLHLFRGQDIELAEQAKGLEQVRPVDADVGLLAYAGRAVLRLLNGDLQSAAEVIQSGITAAEPIFLSEGFRCCWPLALDISLAAGAHQILAQLLAIVEDAPQGRVPPFLRAELVRHRAALAAERGADSDQVAADLSEALRIMTDLGYPYWLASAQRDLGRWLQSQHRRDEALPLLSRAAETFAELQAVPALNETQALLELVAVRVPTDGQEVVT